MCGINGFVSNKPINVHRDSIQRANDIIKHRGPDGQGIVIINSNENLSVSIDSAAFIQNSEFDNTDFNIILGHRRLSVLDLTPLGSQPMGSNNKSIWITFNGEIYNYIELREILKGKGYSFRSNSDTEVIIKAYEEWGEHCVEYFNGMWSFCLVDINKKKVFCSRDRFGIKPFYYYYNGTNFVFGSEIKQLLEYPFIKRYANERAIYEFLAFSAVEYCEETFFQGINKLMHGHSLTINIENMLLDIRRYYNPSFCINNDISFDEASRKLSDLLYDSIRLRLRSDVEVGSCLSGGLDSTSIVCIMNNILRDNDKSTIQSTFSSHFNEKEANELSYMQEVIKKTGVSAKFIEPKKEDLINDLRKIIWHQDEPFSSSSIFAQWSVFKLVNQNKVKVMIDGQGADEQLAGYIPLTINYLEELKKKNQYYKYFWETIKYISNHLDTNWEIVLKGKLNRYISKIRKNSISTSNCEWINSDLTNSYKDIAIYPKFFQERVFGENEVLNNTLYQLTFNTNLQSLLHYEDRNSMAFSVESRVPFLDYRLVEFIFSLPSNYKINNGNTKVILRKSMDGIIPERIRTRKSKLGFATPEKSWQKTILRPQIEQALQDEKIKKYVNTLQAHQYQNIIDKSNTKDWSSWKWICLSQWMEEYNVK